MQEIKPLTSLRGIAALAVVLQHFSATAQPLTPHWIPSLVPHGYMAVHFFFVLSGFIMCLTYLPAFEANGIRAFPGFLMKRVARIVPLNLFVLLVLIVFGLVGRAVSGVNIFFDDSSVVSDLTANILMVQGLGIGNNLNPPSWSISTEFAAYFLFPLFIVIVFNSRRFVSIIALLIAVVGVCSVANGPHLAILTETIGGRILYCFCEFVLGMGAYILYRLRNTSGGEAGDREVALVFAAIVVFLVTGIDLFVALLCPFVVVAVALNRGRFARILSEGVPYFLGLVSFSIYLIHQPFRSLGLLLFSAMHPQPAGPITALLFALVGSLVVIPFAWLTYVWIERPGRQVIRRWSEKTDFRKAPPISVSPRA
jgi:peptidoglycan/LPS O-acetylase OafA/YrhL